MWLNAVVRGVRDHLTVVVLVILCAAIPVGCDNRETILVIEQPTEVHSIAQSPSFPASTSTGLEPGKVIATLKVGETVKATGVYHGQDYDGFKVKLADGAEGLIIAGDTFKVVSR
ncbi:MAG: hypothetical protein JSS39_11690 [Nitrospira sp.]|nr:hypothetical protein [Nitrospira sp.]